MVGIIKGKLQDETGDIWSPGRPVTLTMKRDDGLPDTDVVTDDQGVWQVSVESTVSKRVRFSFFDKTELLGSHDIDFIKAMEMLQGQTAYSSANSYNVFYGRLVDGNGDPVAAADISFTYQFDGAGTVYTDTTQTSAEGLFSVNHSKFQGTLADTESLKYTFTYGDDTAEVTYSRTAGHLPHTLNEMFVQTELAPNEDMVVFGKVFDGYSAPYPEFDPAHMFAGWFADNAAEFNHTPDALSADGSFRMTIPGTEATVMFNNISRTARSSVVQGLIPPDKLRIAVRSVMMNNPNHHYSGSWEFWGKVYGPNYETPNTQVSGLQFMDLSASPYYNDVNVDDNWISYAWLGVSNNIINNLIACRGRVIGENIRREETNGKTLNLCVGTRNFVHVGEQIFNRVSLIHEDGSAIANELVNFYRGDSTTPFSSVLTNKYGMAEIELPPKSEPTREQWRATWGELETSWYNDWAPVAVKLAESVTTPFIPAIFSDMNIQFMLQPVDGNGNAWDPLGESAYEGLTIQNFEVPYVRPYAERRDPLSSYQLNYQSSQYKPSALTRFGMTCDMYHTEKDVVIDKVAGLNPLIYAQGTGASGQPIQTGWRLLDSSLNPVAGASIEVWIDTKEDGAQPDITLTTDKYGIAHVEIPFVSGQLRRKAFAKYGASNHELELVWTEERIATTHTVSVQGAPTTGAEITVNVTALDQFGVEMNSELPSLYYLNYLNNCGLYIKGQHRVSGLSEDRTTGFVFNLPDEEGTLDFVYYTEGGFKEFSIEVQAPPRFAGYVITSCPLEATVGETITIEGKAVDQYGNPRPEEIIYWYVDGEQQPLSWCETDGTFALTHSSKVTGDVVYKFDDKPFEGSEATVTWTAAPPVFSTTELITPPAEAATGTTVGLRVKCLDQYGDLVTSGKLNWSVDGILQTALDIPSGGVVTVDVTHSTVESVQYQFWALPANKTSHDISWVAPLVLTTIEIYDTAANANVGDTVTVTGKCLDQNGNPIGGMDINWYKDDVVQTEITVPANGIFTQAVTQATPGDVVYTFGEASLGAGRGSHTITWAGVPEYSGVEFVSGPATAETGTTVKLVVRTIDQFGNPIPNKPVNLQYGSNPPSPTWNSDENGLSDWNVTAEEAGDVIYRFGGFGGESLEHTITWTTPTPVYTNLELVSGPTEANVGETVKIVVRTIDQFGNPMADQPVNMQYGSNRPSPIWNSDENGLSEWSVTGEEAGAVEYRFGGGYAASESFKHTITWSVPTPEITTITVVAPDRVSASKGGSLEVATFDQNGDPMGNVAYQILVNGEAVAGSHTTDANGVDTYSFASMAPDTYTFKVQVVSDTTIFAEDTSILFPVTVELAAGTPTTADVGTKITFNMKTVDPDGVAVPKHVIRIYANDEWLNSFFSGVDGTYEFETQSDVAGDILYRFDVAGSPATEHTVTWNDATPVPVYSDIVVKAGSDTTAVVGEKANVTVITVDQNGDPMAGQAVTWSLNNGVPFPVATSDANGEIAYQFDGSEAGEALYKFFGAGDGASHTVTWTAPTPPYNTITLSPKNPTEMEVGDSSQINGTCRDPQGNLLGRDHDIPYFINGVESGTVSPLREGIFTLPISGPAEGGDVVYRFGDNVNYQQVEHTVTWTLPPKYDIVVDANAPTTGDVGSTITITGEVQNEWGDNVNYERLPWFIDGVKQADELNTEQAGGWTVDVSASEAGDVVYTFGDPETQIQDTHTVTWAAATPTLASIEIKAPIPTEGFVGNWVSPVVLTKDQFGNPIGGIRFKYTDDQGSPESEFYSTHSATGETTMAFKVTEPGTVVYTFTTEDGNHSCTLTLEWKQPPPRYTNIVFVQGPDTFNVGETALVQVRTTDQYGNPMGRQYVSMSWGSNPPGPTYASDDDGFISYNLTSDTAEERTYRFRGGDGDGYDHVINWVAPAPKGSIVMDVANPKAGQPSNA